jgi:hypothetical protein
VSFADNWHPDETLSMTLHSFGKAVPIQMDLLQLVGYEASGRDMRPASGGNARERTMREGLHSLRRMTGVDFGYDAAAWRDYLINHADETGYTHPYAFESVDRAVVEALTNSEVLDTLRQLSTPN